MNAGRRRIKYADTIERRSLEFVIPLNGRWTGSHRDSEDRTQRRGL